LKTNLSIASIWFAAMTLAAQAAPASNFLVVDRTALLEQSKAGQDIIRQVKAATDEVDIRCPSSGLSATPNTRKFLVVSQAAGLFLLW